MHAFLNTRRTAQAAALIAITASGLAIVAPADATTGPTAKLHDGTVIVTGTTSGDVMTISMDATKLTVDFGADGTIDAQFARADYTRLTVHTGQGDDGVGVFGTGDVPVTIVAGAGDDGIGVDGHVGQSGDGDAPTIIDAGAGNDRVFAGTPGLLSLRAGAGNDVVEGGGAGAGRENISLGAGDDRFLTSITGLFGVRNDIVDGGSGQNTMEMDGTFESDHVSLSSAGGHLIVVQNLHDRVDANAMQDVSYVSFGGSNEDGTGDTIDVGDLSGTGVVNFTPDFSAGKDDSAPDNTADTLVVSGTEHVDHIKVSGSGAHITVAGLRTTVTPVWLQPADVLEIDTLGGNDTVDSSGLDAGLVQLKVL